MAQHVIEAAAPGLVGVAADVDALGKLELPGLRVLQVEVDVENEVADLLDRTPRCPVRARFSRVVAFAPVAVPDLRPARDFALQFGGNGDESESPGTIEFFAQQLIEHAQAGFLFGFRRFERRIDHRKAEECAARRIGCLRRCCSAARRAQRDHDRQWRAKSNEARLHFAAMSRAPPARADRTESLPYLNLTEPRTFLPGHAAGSLCRIVSQGGSFT